MSRVARESSYLIVENAADAPVGVARIPTAASRDYVVFASPSHMTTLTASLT